MSFPRLCSVLLLLVFFLIKEREREKRIISIQLSSLYDRIFSQLVRVCPSIERVYSLSNNKTCELAIFFFHLKQFSVTLTLCIHLCSNTETKTKKKYFLHMWFTLNSFDAFRLVWCRLIKFYNFFMFVHRFCFSNERQNNKQIVDKEYNPLPSLSLSLSNFGPLLVRMTVWKKIRLFALIIGDNLLRYFFFDWKFKSNHIGRKYVKKNSTIKNNQNYSVPPRIST